MSLTQEMKARMYDDLIREADVLQREIGKLKATNAGINLSDAILHEIALLENKKGDLHIRLQRLFI